MKLRRTLKLSTLDGASFSFMVGIGETYLPAFALALGLSQVFSGLVSVIPLFIGAFLQLFSYYGPSYFNSRKNWVSFCAFFQGLSLFCIAFLPFFDFPKIPWILFFASLYWAFGMATGPAWNAWMGNEVPGKLRISYFSFRTKIAQIATLLGLVCGGVFLSSMSDSAYYLTAYSFLFTCAACARFFSSYLLYQHQETPPQNLKTSKFSIISLVSWVSQKRVKYLLLFLFVTQIAVFFSSPYFNPFMLVQMKLDYAHYMVLISAIIVSKIFTYSLMSKIAQKNGSSFLILIGSLGIIPLPFLWTVSHAYFFILALQLFGGFLWGCFELGVFLYIIERHEEVERTKIVIITNFLNACGMLIGSYSGAWILKTQGSDMEAYHSIFTLSTLLRFTPLLLLPIFFEKGASEFKEVFMRTIGIRPNSGTMDRPLVFMDRENKDSTRDKK